MAEISTVISYTVRFNEREYKLLAKSLALLAGVEGPKATPEDRVAAAQLNNRLLDQQATDLREKLAVAEHKRKEKA
jgi:flagellar biosynthesis regulator FlaF